MEQLRRIAAEYYINFQSPKYFLNFKSWELYTTILFAILFVYFSINTIIEHVDLKLEIHRNWNFGCMLISEVLFLIIFGKLKVRRDAFALNSICEKYPDCKAENIFYAKKYVLENIFNTSNKNFLVIAKELNNMLILSRDETALMDISADSFFDFIYNEKSKQGVLTLIVLIFSMLALFAFRDGYNLASIYSFYSPASWGSIALAYFSILVLILMVVIFIKVIFNLTRIIIIRLGLLIDRNNYKGNYTVKFIIRDLVNHIEYDTKKKDGQTQIILLGD